MLLIVVFPLFSNNPDSCGPDYFMLSHLLEYALCENHAIGSVHLIVHGYRESGRLHSSYDIPEKLIVCGFDHGIENDLACRRENPEDLSPENIVVKFGRDSVVDEKIDDDQSVFMRGFLYKIIRILADDFGICIGIEVKLFSSHAYDHGVYIDDPYDVRNMELISYKLHHRSSTESQKQDILLTRICYLAERESHDTMQRTERIIGVLRIEKLFPVYEHYIEVSIVFRLLMGYEW